MAITLLGLSIHNLTLSDLFNRLKMGGVVVTPNVDHLSKLQQDPDFAEAYQAADYRVCDSQILKIVANALGTPLQEKISGSDLLPAFCNHFRHDESITLFLLGAQEGVAATVQHRVNLHAGRRMVVDVYSPPFGFEQDPAECDAIIERIKQSGATVVVVGLGAPKQEKWIHKYKQQLPQVRVFLAVGAAIDFMAGHRQRSPQWMSEMGLEWLHRLCLEPRRLWKRYLIDGIPVLVQLLLLVVQTRLEMGGGSLPTDPSAVELSPR